MEFYKAEENRYADMIYRRCGRSGILLPAVSLGLWHNFGVWTCSVILSRSLTPHSIMA